MIWYACRNGTLQNFVAIYPDSDPVAHADLDPVTCKQMLLRIFGHFHPEVLAVLAMATDVRLWPLYTLAPLPRWSTRSAILIGDAAHPVCKLTGRQPANTDTFVDAAVQRPGRQSGH
jgi:salicylate hydroxylase